MRVIGYIDRAVDGDTLQVTLEGETAWNRQGPLAYATKWRRACKVRLLGINTAELHAKDATQREKALAAQRFTKSWIDGVPSVFVDYDEAKPEDSFGRVLATVLHPQTGQSLSEALLSADLAVPFTRAIGDEMGTLQPVVW